MTVTMDKPNILWIILDDNEIGTMQEAQTYPFLSGDVATGNSWLNCTTTVLTQPLCFPLRASIMRGQRSDHNGVVSNYSNNKTSINDIWGTGGDDETIGRWMQRGGYWTSLIGKYLNGYPWLDAGGTPRPDYIPRGWHKFCGNGESTGVYSQTYYTGTPGAPVEVTTGPTDYWTDVVTDLTIDAINEGQASGKPWFIYCAPTPAHSPFTPAPRHASAPIVVSDPPDFNTVGTGMPAAMNSLPALDSTAQALARSDRVQSRQATLAADDLIRDVFATLTATGQLDNTIVFLLTDNGQSYGRRRLTPLLSGSQAKNQPYRWCHDMQLLIRWPGQTARDVTEPIGSNDLTRTALSFAGYLPPNIQQDGLDLRPLIDGTATNWRTHIEGLAGLSAGAFQPAGGSRFIRTPGWSYFRVPATGERCLFDLTADPYEMVNVAATYEPLRAEMGSWLAVLLAVSAGQADRAQRVGLG